MLTFWIPTRLKYANLLVVALEVKTNNPLTNFYFFT